VFWHEGFGEDGRLAAVPYRTYSHTWERACQRAKVADLHVHDLKRYSTDSLTTKAGVDEATIMRLAGWRSRSMFDRYSIRNNEDLANGVRKLAEATAEDKSQQARRNK
jgi:integrase